MTSQFHLSSLPANGPEAYGLRFECVMIAGAAGDALGWMTESVRDVEQLRNRFNTDWLTYYRDWSKPEGGARGYMDRIRRGDYSDDTQLTLAVARSLRGDGSLDVEYFAYRELPAWLDYARGAGSATLAAARAFRDSSVRWNKNFYSYARRNATCDYRDAGGNGAAMRVAPIALANLNEPDLITDGVWRSAITTHGHPRAIVGALLYAHALRLCFFLQTSTTREDLAGELIELLNGISPPPLPEFDKWLAMWNRRADTTFDNLLEKITGEAAADLVHLTELSPDAETTRRYMEALGCFRPETKGSGTGTVLAALAIATTERDDIQQALPWTINQLGSDTDTIGAFVGGLCGAIHGPDFGESIWFYELQDYIGISHLTGSVLRVADRLFPPRPISLPRPTRSMGPLPLLMERIKADDLSVGEWAFHPIHTEGKVREVTTAPLRNDPQSQVRLVRVDFETAQSCQFKHYL